MNNLPSIIILTPVKNAVDCLEKYFEVLTTLDYPKKLLSLGFLESDSTDGTHNILKNKLGNLRSEYFSAELWKKDFGFTIPDGMTRHDNSIQVNRRQVLAKSRNHLLSHALDEQEYVLWIDVDVIWYPNDVIQQMLSTGKNIVHPHCVIEPGGYTFDLNAWKDHGKKHLEDMRTSGKLVELDTVGGTMLLVKADLHRDGLVFPPFPYGLRNDKIRTNNYWQGEIETEGFGIMADDLGEKCWGMPLLEILHKKG